MKESFGKRNSSSPVLVLIVANLVLFIIQNLSKVFRSVSIEWFAVTTETIFGGRLWTFLTCFFHDMHQLSHIFFNMLMLFFVGNSVISLLGNKKFYYLYFTGALAGAVVWLSLLDYGFTTRQAKSRI